MNGTQLEDGGQPRLTKKIVSDSTLTVAGPTDLTDAFVGGAWMTDGTTAVGGTYKQTPYTLTTSQITGVSSESFNATYTGVTYSGYEGKNAFDISEDKLPFPNGIGPLDNSENQKSTRASDNETVTIALSEDIEVTADSEIYILFQSEAKSGQPTPVVRVVGRDSTYEAMNPDDQYLGAVYRWLQIPASVGNIYEIRITSTTGGIAGLAQVKVDGANVVEGVYRVDLTFTDPCVDLQYFKVGDIVQSEFNLIQNQNYSDGIVTGTPAQAGTTWEKAFDGNMIIGDVAGVYNLAAATTNQSYNLLFPQPEAIQESLQFVYMNENSGQDGLIKVVTNLGTVSFTDAFLPNTATDSQEQSQVFSRAFLGNPTSILGFEMSGGISGWTGIAGVFIDGRLLTNIKDEPEGAKVIAPPDVANRKLTVDGGTWGTSDVIYSQPPIFDDNGYGSHSHVPGNKSSVDLAFNGVIGNTYTEGTLPEVGGTWSWDFGTMFDADGPQTVEIFYIAGGADNVLSVNGADQSGLTISANTETLTLADTVLKSVSIQYPGGTYCYLMGIKVGGVLLVDETMPTTTSNID